MVVRLRLVNDFPYDEQIWLKGTIWEKNIND